MNNPSEINIADRRKNRGLLIVEIYRAANGCRGRRVLLSDIAKKLGITEGEAKSICIYYQDEYYFKEAFGGMVSLNHYGIVSIDRNILESQDPPDLVFDIQKRQILRFRLLKKLFEKTGGSSQEKVNFYDIAKGEGISENGITCFLYYLMDEGYIKAMAAYWVSITNDGIKEIEEWMEAQTNEGQTSQLDQQPGSVHSVEIALSRKLKVFLCHSSKDKPTVVNLYDRLSADSIEAWLDKEDLLAGQDWELEIKKSSAQ